MSKENLNYRTLMIRLNHDIHHELRKYVLEKDSTLQDVVSAMIKDFLEANKVIA